MQVRLAAVAVVLAAAPAAPAQVVIQTNQATFNAALAPGSYTETFTGLILNGVQSQSFPIPPVTSSFAYTATAGNANGVYANGNFIGNFNPNQTFILTFTGAPVRAIGGNFFISDQNDVFVSAPVTITYRNGTTVLATDTFTPASTATFRGITVGLGDLNITTLTMSAPVGVNNFNTMDNLTVGTVPEPGSLALCGGAAVAGFGWYRRRKTAS
jgi:hypothetical protein